MSQRDRYEPGVPCWVTTMQPDVDAAAEYYGAVFGWEYADGGGFLTARAARPRRGRDRADRAGLRPAARRPAGSRRSASRPPTGRPSAPSARAAASWPARSSSTSGACTSSTDPDRRGVQRWEPRTRHGAQLVNEPGAWAMSRLDTPDPDGAAAFYGEVFGWTTEAFGPATHVPPARLRRRRARAAGLARGRRRDDGRRGGRALVRRLLGRRPRRRGRALGARPAARPCRRRPTPRSGARP